MFSFFNGPSSLSKLRDELRSSQKKFKRFSNKVSVEDRQRWETLIQELREAIQEKNREKGTTIKKKLEALEDEKLPSSWLYSIFDFCVAVVLALLVAIILRQVLFEPYMIPTGSMRPQYRENDQLFVSKTTFGINVPMIPGHFYFNPDLLERGNIVTLTVQGLPVPDQDTTYFWLIPYKKRFIKRLIGKPGDTLYFHGGRIYGIDKNGEPIEELLTHPWMEQVEHVPFINFLQVVSLFDKKNFNAETAKRYGIDNFAQVRLLTPDQLEQTAPGEAAFIAKAPYYLEIFHHFDPTAYESQISRSYLPLTEDHMNRIKGALYTSRFTVKNEQAFWIGGSTRNNPKAQPILSGVPDGTYEFDKGTLYEVLFGGRRQSLDATHPLNNKELLPILFNVGLEFHIGQSPEKDIVGNYPPSRFAYFRDGALYLMGSSILSSDDAALQTFIAQEKKKTTGFFPIQAPNASGWDIEKIQRYGIKIPEKKYLVLGDNHAQSGDSRSFGFVPEDNLRGSPVFNIWPFDERFGSSAQAMSYSFSPISIGMWAFILGLAAIFTFFRRRKI